MRIHRSARRPRSDSRPLWYSFHECFGFQQSISLINGGSLMQDKEEKRPPVPLAGAAGHASASDQFPLMFKYFPTNYVWNLSATIVSSSIFKNGAQVTDNSSRGEYV